MFQLCVNIHFTIKSNKEKHEILSFELLKLLIIKIIIFSQPANHLINILFKL